VEEILKTGFGRCRLSILAPKANGYKGPQDLLGKRIVTSFPKTTKIYYENLCRELAEQSGETSNVRAIPAIRMISGAVEVACGLGLSEGVVDLVETGESAQAAGLGEIGVIMYTEAVLIRNPKPKHPEIAELIRKRIEGYIIAQKYSMMYYNVARVNLLKAELITPGKRAPTITPLEDPAWVSVGAMVLNSEVSSVMDNLQLAGAQDIFVMAISNCRP
jgi:ATP phosphoribosyltransferase